MICQATSAIARYTIVTTPNASKLRKVFSLISRAVAVSSTNPIVRATEVFLKIVMNSLVSVGRIIRKRLWQQDQAIHPTRGKAESERGLHLSPRKCLKP